MGWKRDGSKIGDAFGDEVHLRHGSESKQKKKWIALIVQNARDAGGNNGSRKALLERHKFTRRYTNIHLSVIFCI